MSAKQIRKKTIPGEIFLSHAHQDHSLTLRLARTLNDHGLRPWYSERHIPGAKQWLDEIGAALDRCDWFVVLLTPSAVRSKWVKRELTYALNQDRYEDRIVPLLVEPCDYAKLAWPLAALQLIPFQRHTPGCKSLFQLWSVPYRP
jgi:glyoxylase-like metal-dependent hydrolase (beta-lactamase superfamily II)